MSRSITTLFLAGALGAAAPVLAQPGAVEPRVEVGADAVVAAQDADLDDPRVVVAPRLTVRLTPRTSLAVAGDGLGTAEVDGGFSDDTRAVTAELRRALLHRGRLAVSVFGGGGLGWQRSVTPAFSYPSPDRDEILTIPAMTNTDIGGEVTLGLGLEQRVASRLALRQEVRVMLGEISDMRFQAGVSVPIGRYPTEFAPLRTKAGGSPDTLANGTLIGGIIGTAAMTGFALWITQTLCDGECSAAPAIGVGLTYGGGSGALLGALVDSLIE